MAAKKPASKKINNSPLILFKNLAILCLIGYSIYVLISQQVELSEKRSELSKVKGQISIAQQKNDEFQRLLNLTNEKDYMEKIAVEKLGYAYPSEIRFYDTSKN